MWWQSESLIKFVSPSILYISGPTMSGKSCLTKRILEHCNAMFTQQVTKIIYAYSEWQSLYDEMKKTVDNLEFYQGLPDREAMQCFGSTKQHVILCIDDLFMQVTQSEDAVQLFCVFSHHLNISVIFLAQSLYPPGRFSKTLSLQVQYYFLLRNRRDKRQVITFASQLFPSKSKYMLDAYEKCTERVDYNYLLIDISPSVDQRYQLRSNIFPGETTVCYLPLDYK